MRTPLPHRLARLVPAHALAVLLVCTLAPHAARAEDEPLGLPLTFEALAWDCSSRCIAEGPTDIGLEGRPLLCLSGGEGLSCDDCAAAWVAPTETDSSRIAWKSLQACGQMKPQRNAKNLRAVNARAKPGTRPLATSVSLGPTDGTAPTSAREGGLELALDRDALSVVRDGKPLGTADWRARAQPIEGEQVTVTAYPLGADRALVALVVKVPDMVVQRTVWLVVGGASDAREPVGIPDGVSPARALADLVAPVLPLMERFCAGTLDDQALAELASQVRAGTIRRQPLTAVWNLLGAFYGYTFTQERWLNDLYYDAASPLPPTCRERIRAFPSAAAVPAPLQRQRDRVKAIWKTAR